ncbi:MAG: peptidylprolyl isomerase [Candidatus Hydrogenedentota bacterium]
MKGKFVTAVVVIAVLAGIVGINQFEPNRKTQEQYEAQLEAQRELEEIAALEDDGSDGNLITGDMLEIAMKQAEERKAEREANAGDYTVRFECSNGDFVIEVESELAPLGAAQFKKAVKDGVYDGARFFRVISGALVQFGISGDPEKSAIWHKRMIKDDPVKGSNTRGTISFATSGPDSRTSQVFINFRDNTQYDGMGFAPFGKVIEGMDVLEAVYSKDGQNPDQGAIRRKGNAYLESAYPNLDYINKAILNKDEAAEAAEEAAVEGYQEPEVDDEGAEVNEEEAA